MPPWPWHHITFLLICATSLNAEHHRQPGSFGHECICERRLKPVCSNEGRTYENMCQFECMRRMQPSLSVMYIGSCCTSSSLCPEHVSPVCDNYGTVHSNPCHFEYQKCLARKMYGVVLRVNARENCGNDTQQNGKLNSQVDVLRTVNGACDFDCNEDGEPLCDDRGKTHKNQCIFEKLLCNLHLKHLPLLTIAHKGECATEDKIPSGSPKPAQIFGVPIHELSADPPLSEAAVHNDDPGTRLFHPQPDPFVASADPYETLVTEATTLKVPVVKEKTEAVTSEQLLPHQNGTGQVASNQGQVVPNPGQVVLTPEKPGQQVSIQAGSGQQVSIQSGSGTSSSSQTGSGQKVSIQAGSNLPSPTQTGTNQQSPVSSNLPSSTQGPVNSNQLGSGQQVATSKQSGLAQTSPSLPNAASPSSSVQLTTSTQYSLIDHDSQQPQRPPILNDSEFKDGEECSAVECYRKWEPVCDNRNQTHRNECLFKFRVCKLKKDGVHSGLPEIVYKGQCKERSPIPSIAPSSNSIQAKLNAAKGKVQIAREGFCKVCNLQEEQQHVCTNANITFSNACDLAQWNCERRTHGVEEQILVHVGACRNNSLVFTMQNEVCPSTCPRHYKPVCDSDGTTFPNLCTFQMVNCHERKMKKPDPSWLVALRECPQPDADISSENQQQISSTPPSASPSSLSTNAPANNSQTEVLEEHSFVCPDSPCPEEEAPVCDQEGTIHRNECEFTRARCLAAKGNKILHVVEDDQCPAKKCRLLNSQPCTTDFDPICATDFRTLPNLCTFERAKCQDPELDILFKGECKQCLKAPCPLLDESSSDDSQFLCDQNGETKSRCEFEMVRCIYEIKFGYNITPAYEGKCCPAFETCPTNSAPICDVFMKEHRNECNFKIASCRAQKIEHSEPLQILRNGSCMVTVNEREISQIPPDSSINPLCQQTLPPCSDIYDPVCGSDHHTYPNECQFFQSMCNSTRRKPLQMLYKGSCCSDECADEQAPVCDNENKTHLNLCKFGYQRCLANRLIGKNLTVHSYSACQDDSCDLNCPKVYQPVCAKNGKTYVNECELKRFNCFAQKHNATVQPVEIDYPNECCSRRECPRTFEPVCDTQRNVYPNQCEFDLRVCEEQRRSGARLEKLANSAECFEGKQKRNQTTVHSASYPRLRFN